MSIRTVIVDDELLARQRVREFAGRHSDLDIIGEAASGARVRAEPLLQHFNCNLAAERVIRGSVDHAHAAVRNLGAQSVALGGHRQRS